MSHKNQKSKYISLKKKKTRGKRSIPEDEEEEEQVTETFFWAHFLLEEAMEPRGVAQVELAPDCTNKLEDFHPRELFTLQITKFQFDRNWGAPRRTQIPNSERERERELAWLEQINPFRIERERETDNCM